MFDNIPMNRPGPEDMRIRVLGMTADQLGDSAPAIITQAKNVAEREWRFARFFAACVAIVLVTFIFVGGGPKWLDDLAVIYCIAAIVWMTTLTVRACRGAISARYIQNVLQEAADILRSGHRRVPPTPSRTLLQIYIDALRGR